MISLCCNAAVCIERKFCIASAARKFAVAQADNGDFGKRFTVILVRGLIECFANLFFEKVGGTTALCFKFGQSTAEFGLCF